MQNSLVSIVIPTFNAVAYIEETVNCFLAQSYHDIEIIIQDDTSTDGTWELLNNAFNKHPKIRLFRNEYNLGIGMNWNEAYNRARGEFIVIFNADDWVPSNFISIIKVVLDKYPELDFCCCPFVYRIENDGSVQVKSPNKSHKKGPLTELAEKLLSGYPFSHVFTIHRKKSLSSLLLKDGNLFVNHQVCDFELWLRMGLSDKIGFYTDEIQGVYRIHNTNNSSKRDAEFSGNNVVFQHHVQLKQKLPKVYRKWIKTDLINHLKACVKQKRLPHFPASYRLIKYYLK